jgi:hypothetical protein
LSSTVEVVERLNLTLEGLKLSVDFSGRRRKVYVNKDAHRIEVRGSLELEQETETVPG